MRKNRMMRLASALLILTMVTTCAISGTFAKYVSSDSATDTARVARWGFGSTSFDIQNLFLGTYTHVSTSGGDIIAPGTEGSATIDFKPANGAAPEVAYEIEVAADTTADMATNTIIANENIQWAFHKQGETATWGTFAAMLSSIEALSEAEIAAGSLPKLNETYVVEWQWVFYTDDAADAVDTDMGDAASLENIDLTITITATQLD